MTIDLSLLPAPEVIDTLSLEALIAEYKADFVARYPAAADTIDLESEPIVKLLEVAAYRETVLRARYNDEARALLLAHSTGTDLDHIGITYYDGEERLVITPADPLAVPPVAAVYELDADFRTRLALKPESYSVAGPTGAYLFHALSASGQVKSASVTSPHGGTTEVFILSRTGSGVPDQALLDVVAAALNDESIRPLSEEVIVSPAEVVNYTIDVSLILYPGPSGEIVLQAAQTALAKLAAAQHRCDGDVIDTAIDAAAHQTGVKKVIKNSPAADVVCGPGQAPYCTGITVTIAGVEA
jgi:phage-related baseplate assembly protein